MADLAEVYHDQPQTMEYRRMREYYREKFYHRFYDPVAGCFSGGKQTPNILALALNVARSEDQCTFSSNRNLARGGLSGTRWVSCGSTEETVICIMRKAP